MQLFLLKVNNYDVFMKSLQFYLVLTTKIDFQIYVYPRINLAYKCEENFDDLVKSCSYNILRKVGRSRSI